MILNDADNIMLGADEVDRVYCGSVIVWERLTPLDETEIAAVLLDSSGAQTRTVVYFETLSDAKTYLSGRYGSHADERYLLYVGDESGVTAFGENELKDAYNVKAVRLPDSVTSVGKNAFLGCVSLTSVEMPDSCALGQYAFQDCASLESFDVPADATSLPIGIFKGCVLLNDVTIPSAVTSLPEQCFEGCASIGDAEFAVLASNNIHTIQSNAFKGCGMTEVKIGSDTITIDPNTGTVNGVTRVVGGAFANCESLVKAEVCTSVNDKVTTLYGSLFTGCTSLENVSFSDEYYWAGELLPRVVIPPYCFKGCTSLESFTFHTYFSTEQRNVFEGCTALKEVTFGAGGGTQNIHLTAIGQYFFKDCSNLERIVFPLDSANYITKIAQHAFSGCSKLQSIPAFIALEQIGTKAFYGCTSLASVSLPSTMTTIGSNAFQGCTSLASITIAKQSGAISGAPWGAPNATVVWTG